MASFRLSAYLNAGVQTRSADLARIMNPSASPVTAARLCAQCGLCCNGVLFHSVQLQPGDIARDLSALGLKLKHKHGGNYLLQPCPAFQGAQCAIYAARPERCRLFECQQLKRVAAGQITETMASVTIREARRQVDQIHELLQEAGSTNLKRPFSKRCEKALAERLTVDSAPADLARQDRLRQAMQQLNALLNDHFRIVPSQMPSAPDS